MCAPLGAQKMCTVDDAGGKRRLGKDRMTKFALQRCSTWRRALCFASVVCLALGGTVRASAQPAAIAPNYWQQPLFFIPYQVNRQDPSFQAVAKVQLLVSRDGMTDWRTLEEATPNVQGFSYLAPKDGEFWFALRHLDQRGQPWPNAAVQPQMRVIVDTQQPELALSGGLDATGAVVVRYEARDANLRPETLVIEVRPSGGPWSALRLGPPDVTHFDRLLGRVAWDVPSDVGTVEVRGTIADAAGHRAESHTEVAVSGPSMNSPASTPEQDLPFNMASADPFRSTVNAAEQDWPANNRLPAGPAVNLQAPPEFNPYTAAPGEEPTPRTPARLIGETRSDLPSTRHSFESPLTETNEAPPVPPGSSPLSERTADQSGVRTVNSTTFDVEYDLQSVGPWGVAKVELWGTCDGGRTWQSFGVDTDNRSPARVTVPGEGVYGFRLLVDAANGAGSTPPRGGEQPELTVAVDLQPPRVERLTAAVGQGNLAGHLVIRWSASDTNLESRPISLFYGTFPNGPWSTIAAGLENSGSFTWRLERHVPDRFYLRLESRDVAGNVGASQTPAPITLDRPQPTGRLRGVRPVVTDPQRFDTAERSL